MFHPPGPTFTPASGLAREEQQGRRRSKSPPPRVAKPLPKPLPATLAAKATNNNNNAFGDVASGQQQRAAAAGAAAGPGPEESLGGEPFATYADDVRELVSALQRALKDKDKEEEEEEETEGEEEKKKGNSKLSEAVSVTRAFLHQQLRLAGEQERKSLAELKNAVRPLISREEEREGRRRRREAGAEEEEEEKGEGEGEEPPLSAELLSQTKRGLEATLAVLLVEEEAARDKGLLH